MQVIETDEKIFMVLEVCINNKKLNLNTKNNLVCV